MVLRIQQLGGFAEVVKACELVLQTYGIVLVVCKGGNHRSPTVAHIMRSEGRFVIHATLFTRRAFHCTHIAALVHACVRCSNGVDFYSRLIRESEDPNYELQLCVGWTPGDVETREADTSMSFVREGAEVQVLDTCGYECTVRDKETRYTYTLPATWLIPKRVYMERARQL